MFVALAALTWSCAPSEPEPSEAGAAAAPAAEPLDATAADPDHYKVEFENDRVRVVRITYGPGERSVMHYHPDHAAVFLTEQHTEFLLPDGSTQESHGLTGEHVFVPAGRHQPTNVGAGRMEGVLVEVK